MLSRYDCQVCMCLCTILFSVESPCLVVSPHMAQSITHSMQSISKLQSPDPVHSGPHPIPSPLSPDPQLLDKHKVIFYFLPSVGHTSRPTTIPAVPIASFRPLLNHRPLLSGLHPPLPAPQSIPVPPVRMRKSRPPLLESRTRKH
jgi:hypothetical protein